MSDWTNTTVHDVISHVASGPSPTCEARNASGPEWGLLKTTAATWSGWNEDAHKVPPPEYWGQEKLEVRRDDVIVTKAGPRNRVGVVVHVAQTRPGLMVSGKLVLLRPDKSKVVPRLLADVLASPPSQKYLDDRTTGMAEAQTNFANSALLNTPIRLPPPEEQRRIAEILDTIDEAIQAAERVITKLRATWTGAIDEMMRPGWSPDDAPASWSTGIVGDFLHLQRGFDITKDAQRSGDVPVVSSSGIASYHDEAKVKAPGVVIGRKGKLGDAYFIPIDFWPHDTSLWVTDFRGNDPRFIALFLRSLRLQRLDAATSVPTLNRNVVHPLRAAIPSLNGQLQIIGLNDKFEDRVETERREMQKLIEVRAGLAGDLLSGRVRTAAT